MKAERILWAAAAAILGALAVASITSEAWHKWAPQVAAEKAPTVAGVER